MKRIASLFGLVCLFLVSCEKSDLTEIKSENEFETQATDQGLAGDVGDQDDYE